MELAELRPLLEKLHIAIRTAVVQACEQQNLERVADVAEEAEDDTIYAIDRVSEAVLVDFFAREVAPFVPLVLIAEGLPGGQVILPIGTAEATAVYRIIIDPIDGTRNFANGIPMFAVSIALLHNGVPVVAVIHNPATGTTYAAEKGKGMTINGKPTHVSQQPAEKGVVNFGPGQGKEKKDMLRTLFVAGEEYFRSVRYMGCTALELAYVASGGTEGFVCIGLKPWDYAAGRLLIEEAGGKITDYDGNECDMQQNYFVASNGVAHDALLTLVQRIKK